MKPSISAVHCTSVPVRGRLSELCFVPDPCSYLQANIAAAEKTAIKQIFKWRTATKGRLRGLRTARSPFRCRCSSGKGQPGASFLKQDSDGSSVSSKLKRLQVLVLAFVLGVTDSAPSLEASTLLLQEFTKQEARGDAQAFLNTPDKRRLLKKALLMTSSNLWPAANYDPASEQSQLLIGVLASDIRLAIRSLRDYTTALSLPFLLPESRVAGVTALPAITGGVYCKYNAASKSCYVSSYSGSDRGVLVTFGQEQIGHLPLGLFDESMAAPLPAL